MPKDEAKTVGELTAELTRISAESDGAIGFHLSCSRDRTPAWYIEAYEGDTGLYRAYGDDPVDLVARVVDYLSDYQPALEREANR